MSEPGKVGLLGAPKIITTPAPGGDKGDKMNSIPVRAHSFESAQCIWSRAAKHSKVLGRVSSLDTGGDQGTPCVGVECSHERCSNMTSMYKVVKTVTSTKFRHEPFQDFYEVYEEIGRYRQNIIKMLLSHIITYKYFCLVYYSNSDKVCFWLNY